jgi:hypothetical protein
MYERVGEKGIEKEREHGKDGGGTKRGSEESIRWI